MNTRTALLPALTALILPFLSQPLQAVEGSPPYVDYQGTVYDPVGAPLGSSGTTPTFTAAPTNYTMQFKIFSQQDGGTLIWAETQTVTVSLGQFSVRLGLGAPISSLTPAPSVASIQQAFDGKERFLELTVIVPPASVGTAIKPRLQFQSSPFAFVAQRAVRADSVGSDTAGTISGTFVGSGAGITGLDGTQVTTGTIASARLEQSPTVSGTVTAATFVGNGTIPVGGIIMWSGSIATIPTGWKLCDGLNSTPNLQDRFIVGAGLTYNPRTIGGASSVTLTTAQMPSHSHSFSDGYYTEKILGTVDTFGGVTFGNDLIPGSGTVKGSSGNDDDNIYIYTRSQTTASAGSGQAHENRPPYYALAFIMRVQ